MTRTLGWAILVAYSATKVTHLAERLNAWRQASVRNVSPLAPPTSRFSELERDASGARGRTRSERGHVKNLVGNYT